MLAKAHRLIIATRLASVPHDDDTLATVPSIFNNVRNVNLEILESAGRMLFIEEAQRCFGDVGSFLEEHDHSVERRDFGERTNGHLWAVTANLRWT